MFWVLIEFPQDMFLLTKILTVIIDGFQLVRIAVNSHKYEDKNAWVQIMEHVTVKFNCDYYLIYHFKPVALRQYFEYP